MISIYKNKYILIFASTATNTHIERYFPFSTDGFQWRSDISSSDSPSSKSLKGVLAGFDYKQKDWSKRALEVVIVTNCINKMPHVKEKYF